MSYVLVYTLNDCFDDIELLFNKANINLHAILSNMPKTSDTANTELINTQHRIEKYITELNDEVKKLNDEIVLLKNKY